MRSPIRTALAAAAMLAAPLAAPAQELHDKVVAVVTAADAQSQLMAMVLTTQAVQAGAEAHVLLCGPGGDIALRDAPDTATAPQPPMGASPQGLLRGLIDAGATVEVCAIYLPGLDAGPEALIDGAGVAQPPAMAAALRAEDAAIWAF